MKEESRGECGENEHARPSSTPSLPTPPGCYLAIQRGVNVDAALRDWGLVRSPEKAAGGEAASDDTPPSSWTRWLTGGGSALALSFVANKALFPVRAPITITLTPAVARFLRSRAGGSVGGV